MTLVLSFDEQLVAYFLEHTHNKCVMLHASSPRTPPQSDDKTLKILVFTQRSTSCMLRASEVSLKFLSICGQNAQDHGLILNFPSSGMAYPATPPRDDAGAPPPNRVRAALLGETGTEDGAAAAGAVQLSAE